MLLSNEEFRQIVANTPLVSIDLIVENRKGEVLLGYRKNRPAQHTWFVPGGRITKAEAFTSAFLRITRTELGRPFGLSEAAFVGLYEHLYEENYWGDPAFGTHYIVNAFHIRLNDAQLSFPKEQHQEYRWMNKKDIITAEDVHQNTKNYFNGFLALSKFD